MQALWNDAVVSKSEGFSISPGAHALKETYCGLVFAELLVMRDCFEDAGPEATGVYPIPMST